MKKFLCIMGGIFTSLIVIFVIHFSIVMFLAMGMVDDSKLFIDETMPKILSTWNKELFYEHSSSEIKKQLNSSQFEDFWSWLKKLGNLVEVKSVKSLIYRINFGEGKTPTAKYKIAAAFENGNGVITIELQKENGTWWIKSFHVDSMDLVNISGKTKLEI